ncbi:PfaD family polyunsaturated fatty acid/polyketide biosynthesis protein [Streptomyces sp. MNP-20]|uniref:PfaD family polyunsaturated fatty acid/polyketide biosynthesis protein n=1 Tax=Streptomyces sp. MNP-20 TaxID=2721165 RepID=UPI0015545F2C|nr:PfaD family polyunsaturated fatty acid/polyketide biosynthesis protein [Streptomyces sp. MNP-20]
MSSALLGPAVTPGAAVRGPSEPYASYAPDAALDAALHPRETAYVLLRESDGARGVTLGAVTGVGPGSGQQMLGVLPPVYPEWLGDRGFGAVHGTRFAYVSGEMANGIATTSMVTAMARAGMLGIFGAGGLGPARVEQAVAELREALGTGSGWGVNLIHSPNEPELEDHVAGLLIRHGVPRISASAYMGLTPAVVWCSAAGLRTDAAGHIVRRTQLFAKVSHPDVAERFMSPAPDELLRALVADGRLTAQEASLAARVPVAEDITVEADSGGHTDNRPLTALFPVMLQLRDTLIARHRYSRPIRVGAAGGLGTPQAVAAAFALGAAYVVTGSVNQLAVEAGLSEDAKELLAQATIADVVMAPAADMFELGVKLQVLRRGTMFASRATRLYEIYREHPSLEAVPAALRAKLEREVLHATLDEVWAQTRGFWERRDPAQLVRAGQEPKHRMALVFRWYLGRSSAWAIQGEADRRTDFQIWCGPALGAFNQWRSGSFLADRSHCTVTQIALNLLEGAACVTRAQQLRSHGLPVPEAAFAPRPRPLG